MWNEPPLLPPASQAVDTYLVNDAHELLLMRRAFSLRPAPGAFTTSLHGHPDDGEDLVEAARRLALTMLGLGLQDVAVVVASTSLVSPGCPLGEPEPGTILLARTSRRVLTPDPTRFDDASWVGHDDARVLCGAGAGTGSAVPPAVLEAVGAMPGRRR